MEKKVDNADPLLAHVITPGFYLHHIDVADQDPASGRLYADLFVTDLFELK